jgi:PTH1 family peptidyl-tRNA hydrolase
MKLVVGLGNPGAKYEGTRHNVGFAAVDLLAKRHVVQWEAAPRGAPGLIGRWRAADVVLAKPLTFMNLSGDAIVPLLHFYKIEVPDLIVAVDDVNLEAGRVRIRSEGSAGGHNGLKSIIASLGTDRFSRLRLGVGGGAQRNLSPHVLGRFSADEEAVIDAAIVRAVDAMEVFVADGVVAAMNQYNRKDDKTAEDN